MQHFTKGSSVGFVFHSGESVKCPTYEADVPGSNPVKVILKCAKKDPVWKLTLSQVFCI